MKYPYFPGCTLYTKAKKLDDAGRECSQKLGFELDELKDWTCCGATFPLVNDYHIAMSGPTRILADTKARGDDKLVTLCSVCFNVLKRTNHVMRNDEERRAKITDFIERDYHGEVEVLHYLQLLRDEIGFDTLREKVVKPLTGLKVACYYGCLLLRPVKEIGLDAMENPTIFEEFIRALGAEPVEFPYKVECCGAFQTVHSMTTATRCSHDILRSAKNSGADLVITTCPLCQFNLDDRQPEIQKSHTAFSAIPVLYFTQLLALALDLPAAGLGFERNLIDPLPLLKEKGIVS
ncbi:MAG: CoB--CoM heterodisulfide reductase iron-sulfur subunit B family protein [Deltaproteobacteria bacterium]|nr:CoB--CoM heterodisulfide reductase iron-sulfur subunit B family protein [Deltaproteobacteria bacterium]